MNLFEIINRPKTRDFVTVFVSDWFKEQYAFYASIDKDTFAADIEHICTLVDNFNQPNRDVYIEPVDRSSSMYGFFEFAKDDILNPDKWAILNTVSQDILLAYAKLGSDKGILDFQDNTIVADNYEDLFAQLYSLDYEYLQERNMEWAFDFEKFFSDKADVDEIKDFVVATEQ